MRAMLEMRHISKAFSGVKVLDDVNFVVKKGEIHALVGENSAGKSTLIKILSGVYIRDTGEILIDGKPYTIQNPKDAGNIGIRVIYQEFNLVRTLSIAENILMGHFPEKGNPKHLDWDKIYKVAEEITQKIGFNIDVKKEVRELSVAQQQMVEICKALSQQPKILVMDEPTAVLSENELAKLFEIIKSLTKQGVSIIYISHRLEEVFTIANRVTVLRDGRVTGNINVSEVTKDDLINMMVGRKLAEIYPEKVKQKGKEILRIENLQKEGIKESISFKLYTGEILGFAGLVGSGRTELVRAIFGADVKISGDIFIEDRKVVINLPTMQLKKVLLF